jgi:ABC-type sugar transport system permease subunit
MQPIASGRETSATVPPRGAGTAAAKPSRVRHLYRGWAPYVFLSPYLLLTAVFFIYPFVNAISLAFYQTNGPHTRVFVGLQNFQFLLTDEVFRIALWNTTVFACASVFLQLPLSMGLALLLNKGNDRIKGFFRLILFSPNLVGQIFVGILFGVLFTPRYGLINRVFHALFKWGLEERWLNNPNLVMPAIVLTSLWVWVGFNMVYFLAALQTVDKNLEEAARIDGANAWQVFWHVTLPSMRHVVVFVVIMSVIGSYQLFELPLALFHESSGFGPDNTALTVIGYLNFVAFNSGDLGLGSAVGWVVACIIFTISLVQIRVSRVTEE